MISGRVSGPRPGHVTVRAHDGGANLLAATRADASGTYAIGFDLTPPWPLVAVTLSATMDLGHVRLSGRTRLDVRPGQPLRRDFRLDEHRRLKGAVVDQEGHPVVGLEVAAIETSSRDRVVPESAHPSTVESRAAAITVTGADGGFSFHRLEGDAYQIVSLDGAWQVDPPVVIPRDSPPSTVTAAQVLTLDLQVRDIVTGEPIERFEVRFALEESNRDAHQGVAGRLRRRVPRPTEGLTAAWGGQRIAIAVEADGYLRRTTALHVNHDWESRGELTLVPSGVPNATINVYLDTGERYDGELEGLFRPLDGAADNVEIRWMRAGAGVFDARLPPGSWWVAAWPRDALCATVPTLTARVPDTGRWHAELRLPPFGELEFDLPPDAEGDWWFVLRGRRLKGLSLPWQPGTPGLVYTSNSRSPQGGRTIFRHVGLGLWALDLRLSGTVVDRRVLRVERNRRASVVIPSPKSR